MLKKTIKYVDYDGNEREDECYFNLSKAELTKMELSESGGFDKFVARIIAEKDNKRIYNLFEELVLMSYGQKSFDGKTFVKKTMRDGQMIRLRDEFEQTEAFSELMMELISGGEQAVADFINKIIPKEIADQIAKQALPGETV